MDAKEEEFLLQQDGGAVAKRPPPSSREDQGRGRARRRCELDEEETIHGLTYLTRRHIEARSFTPLQSMLLLHRTTTVLVPSEAAESARRVANCVRQAYRDDAPHTVAVLKAFAAAHRICFSWAMVPQDHAQLVRTFLELPLVDAQGNSLATYLVSHHLDVLNAALARGAQPHALHITCSENKGQEAWHLQELLEWVVCSLDLTDVDTSIANIFREVPIPWRREDVDPDINEPPPPLPPPVILRVPAHWSVPMLLARFGNMTTQCVVINTWLHAPRPQHREVGCTVAMLLCRHGDEHVWRQLVTLWQPGVHHARCMDNLEGGCCLGSACYLAQCATEEVHLEMVRRWIPTEMDKHKSWTAWQDRKEDHVTVTTTLAKYGSREARLAMIRTWSAHACFLEKQDDEGWTTAMLLVAFGDNIIHRALLQHWAPSACSLELENKHGWTAPMMLARKGSAAAHKLMIQRWGVAMCGRQVPRLPATHADDDVLRMMLEMWPPRECTVGDDDDSDAEEETTAMRIVRRGSEETQLLLLKTWSPRVCLVECQNRVGDTIVMHLVRFGTPKVHQYLLREWHVDACVLALQNAKKKTAPMMLAQLGNTDVCVAMLRAWPPQWCHPELQDEDGTTLPMLVVRHGGEAAVQAMLRSWSVTQCRPELQDSNGNTVVMMIAARCGVDTIKCMMQAWAAEACHLELTNEHGDTAITLLVERGNEAIHMCLLQEWSPEDCHLDVACNSGPPALMLAEMATDRVLQLMLRRWPASCWQLRTTNQHGISAGMLVAKRGSEETRHLLLDMWDASVCFAIVPDCLFVKVNTIAAMLVSWSSEATHQRMVRTLDFAAYSVTSSQVMVLEGVTSSTSTAMELVYVATKETLQLLVDCWSGTFPGHEMKADGLSFMDVLDRRGIVLEIP